MVTFTDIICINIFKYELKLRKNGNFWHCENYIITFPDIVFIKKNYVINAASNVENLLVYDVVEDEKTLFGILRNLKMFILYFRKSPYKIHK